MSETTNEFSKEQLVELLAGRASIAETVGVDEKTTAALRKRALDLMERREWQRCIDVVIGVVNLGTVHPTDAFILATAYHGLDKPAEAHACMEHGRQLLEAMGGEPPEWLRGGTP